MKCNVVEKIKPYLQGILTKTEEKALEDHIKGCSECQEQLEIYLNESEKGKIKPGEDFCHAQSGEDLSEQKQQKILRMAKYKSRFNIVLSLLLLLFVAYIAGIFLSSMFFTLGKENSRNYKAEKTAALIMEFTFPNVSSAIYPSPNFYTSGSGSGSRFEVKPYFAATGIYALEKQVGKERYPIGSLNMKHLLFSTSINWSWENGSYNSYLYFYHPEQYAGLPAGHNEVTSTNWDALESLPAGTVAELAFSFNQTYSIKQVMNMLADYDLDILWYAIATGLEGTSGQTPLSVFGGVWGFKDLSDNMLSGNSTIRSDDDSVRKEYFLNSMRFLAENESLAKKIYRGNPNNLRLAERCEYLEENGVHVYGVVVTGPAKELLKLRELESIHSPALGEVRLWNWFSRSFSGQLY
ncbi:MAG: anti sigma factor C-terminal domain-containing protein [Desulfotomaculaceae bacterium]|nr:anti sigma factor C-terminal domain-containing protein [Desulfotomaculaceae bacterium]